MTPAVADNKPAASFTDEERRLLQKVDRLHLQKTLRDIGYGKLEVVVRAGKPVRLITTKDERLEE